MADRSEKAQERVRAELEKNPGASTKQLQEAAAAVESSVGELSLRQFNAGYVLPLKRGASGGKRRTRGGGRQSAKRRSAGASKGAEQPSGGRATPSAGGERERVRATLLEFARAFSEAESRAEIVAVLSEVDRFVDRIVGSRG